MFEVKHVPLTYQSNSQFNLSYFADRGSLSGSAKNFVFKPGDKYGDSESVLGAVVNFEFIEAIIYELDADNICDYLEDEHPSVTGSTESEQLFVERGRIQFKFPHKSSSVGVMPIGMIGENHILIGASPSNAIQNTWNSYTWRREAYYLAVVQLDNNNVEPNLFTLVDTPRATYPWTANGTNAIITSIEELGAGNFILTVTKAGRRRDNTSGYDSIANDSGAVGVEVSATTSSISIVSESAISGPQTALNNDSESRTIGQESIGPSVSAHLSSDTLRPNKLHKFSDDSYILSLYSKMRFGISGQPNVPSYLTTYLAMRRQLRVLRLLGTNPVESYVLDNNPEVSGYKSGQGTPRQLNNLFERDVPYPNKDRYILNTSWDSNNNTRTDVQIIDFSGSSFELKQIEIIPTQFELFYHPQFPIEESWSILAGRDWSYDGESLLFFAKTWQEWIYDEDWNIVDTIYPSLYVLKIDLDSNDNAGEPELLFKYDFPPEANWVYSWSYNGYIPQTTVDGKKAWIYPHYYQDQNWEYNDALVLLIQEEIGVPITQTGVYQLFLEFEWEEGYNGGGAFQVLVNGEPHYSPAVDPGWAGGSGNAFTDQCKLHLVAGDTVEVQAQHNGQGSIGLKSGRLQIALSDPGDPVLPMIVEEELM